MQWPFRRRPFIKRVLVEKSEVKPRSKPKRPNFLNFLFTLKKRAEDPCKSQVVHLRSDVCAKLRKPNKNSIDSLQDVVHNSKKFHCSVVTPYENKQTYSITKAFCPKCNDIVIPIVKVSSYAEYSRLKTSSISIYDSVHGSNYTTDEESVKSLKSQDELGSSITRDESRGFLSFDSLFQTNVIMTNALEFDPCIFSTMKKDNYETMECMTLYDDVALDTEVREPGSIASKNQVERLLRKRSAPQNELEDQQVMKRIRREFFIYEE